MTKETADVRYREAGSTSAPVDERTDIITGEGVGLVLPTVALGTRIMSALVDYTVYLVIGGIVWYVAQRVWEPENVAQALTWITTILMVWAVGLPFLAQWLTHGSSLGRLLTSTRTVRYDGGTITMRHALTRAVAGLFDIYLTLGALGSFAIASTARSQRTGDLLAGTIVVTWPRRYRGPQPLRVHPDLDRWARVAIVSPLPGQLSIAARDYLRNAKAMTPERRQERGRDLAAALEPFTAPAPPIGTDPNAFITTTLALREAADFQAAAETMRRQMRTEERLTVLPFSVGQQRQVTDQRGMEQG
ncbi:RDD family protein [Flaviflexus huanghaiensis]|uniref:RDD family protein n=1 Tax=Flaviflexus huanghaiensis TaxID=1111473 RepID=UPI0015FD7894|nr:RDD family protein [Flaviflexus huanghaiensis]